MKELRLNIGGIGMSIKWEKSRILDWPHPHYEDFIFSGKADVNLQIHCGNLPRYSAGEMIFDGKEEGNWRLYRDNSRYIIETFDTQTHKKNKVCFLEPDFQSGDVYIDPESERSRQPRIKKGPFFSLPSLMQPLAEILLVNLLAKENGIMVHGLGISDRGKGIAFLGGSGRGKSTLAEFYKTEKVANPVRKPALTRGAKPSVRGKKSSVVASHGTFSNGVNILSDEHIVIRKEKKQFRLYGTPWPGMAMAASSETVPLNHIFFIEHAPENKIFGHTTIGDLFPLLFLPFWDSMRMEAALHFCEDLLKKIGCKKLGFVKDRSVIDFVRKQGD